ncbi:ABC-2 family transporter protein [Streptococcus parauberis]|uniref:ABC-2 family transporter protein n=1 Tax=Streptococcus parauberis TaxID=1348 RepID=A0A854WBN3_9STRE|nr:ABC transporter permease [Streptococcus parauberis]PCH10677.1 ABC-2 family transporter protein [Streptococcus parauberis]
MVNEIKSEIIKEKRSANSKLMLLVPPIFIIFNIMMGILMGESPEGKSYLMATSFNWYPIMVLPIILSLLVININNKEKSYHYILQRSLGLNEQKMLIAKNLVVIMELFIILLLSSIVIFIFGTSILQEEISLNNIILATLALFIGSLPVIGISFIINRFVGKKFFLLLINFLLTFPSAIFAVKKTWVFFPWSYNLRILTPIIKVHPNGTFLEEGSSFLEMNTVYIGIALSIGVYIMSLVILLNLKRSKTYD